MSWFCSNASRHLGERADPVRLGMNLAEKQEEEYIAYGRGSDDPNIPVVDSLQDSSSTFWRHTSIKKEEGEFDQTETSC